jgi:hypothetical protein
VFVLLVEIATRRVGCGDREESIPRAQNSSAMCVCPVSRLAHSDTDKGVVMPDPREAIFDVLKAKKQRAEDNNKNQELWRQYYEDQYKFATKIGKVKK